MRLYYMVFKHNKPCQRAWESCLVWWFPSRESQSSAQGVIYNRGLIALTESYEPLFASEHTSIHGVYEARDPVTSLYKLTARMPNGDKMDKLKSLKYPPPF